VIDMTTTIHHLVIDGIVHDHDQLQKQHEALGAEYRWARDAVVVAVTMIRTLTHRIDRLDDRVREQQREIEWLRAALQDSRHGDEDAVTSSHIVATTDTSEGDSARI
jgi:hypothetical protein